MTFIHPADTTAQERWNAAVKDLRTRVPAVRINFRRSCCLGCATPEALGFDPATTPYALTFGGQGSAFAWWNGVMVYAADRAKHVRRGWGRFQGRPVDREYFRHGGGVGEIIADTFREHGFTVEWDGTESKTVMVLMPEPTEDWQRWPTA